MVPGLRNIKISRTREAGLTDQIVFETSLRQVRRLTSSGPTLIHMYQTGLETAIVGFYRSIVHHLINEPGSIVVVPWYFQKRGDFRKGTGMGDELTKSAIRGVATTTTWSAACKDCEAERRTNDGDSRRRRKSPARGTKATFEYSDDWAVRTIERGKSRSDRCERHRKAHGSAIKSLAVAYIDLLTIGQVENRRNPTGPLGGLGPLPAQHQDRKREVDLGKFQMGMSDEDIGQILRGLATKRVAIIEAGTGTGKSTFMPFRLMNPPQNSPIRLNNFGPIVVTEPRKAAATGVAGLRWRGYVLWTRQQDMY